MRTARSVRLGDVLDLQRRAVDVELERSYHEIGVRSFGRGLFEKEPISGAQLGTKRVFHIHPGDLVVSNVFGWEGAVAVAGAQHEGMIGSHRFMTWAPSREVDVSYIVHYLGSDAGLDQLRRASPGSAGRNRTLSIKNFQGISLPLPDLTEQRRITAHLDTVQGVASSFSDGRKARIHENVQRTIATALAELSRVTPLAEVAEINPRPSRVDADALVGFVPMAALSAETGAIVGLEERRRDNLTSGYRQFTNGDLIFARITPCMQNGKTAVYSNEGLPVAYGSTEFHVIRTDAALARWLHTVLRTRWFIDQAEQAFTGTAGQQRVPAQFLKDVRVPLPADLEDATKKILHLTSQASAAIGLIERAHISHAALLPAARNQIFNSMR